jgi:hypothetical protein
MEEGKRSGDIFTNPHPSLERMELLKSDLTHTESGPSINIELNGITPKQYKTISRELNEMDTKEKIIWMGRSSQAINIGPFFLCFFFFYLIFPIVIAYFIYLKTRNTIYVITQQRLLLFTGIFTKRIDDVELYRVKDVAFIQPFYLWLFHVSSVQLYTSDPNWGDSLIPGIRDGMIIREKLRRLAEAERDRKGVKEIDYFAKNGQLPSNPNF